jgi:hypothetical protein
VSYSGLTVTTGTTIAKTWADMVRDSVVNTFANATARDSAITAPTEGMYADLADTDSLTRYNGASWDVIASAGAWTDFSSAFNLTSDAISPTKGNSTVDSRYLQIGKTVHFMVRYVIGSTFSAGSGTYRWSLPVVASTASTNGVAVPTFINDSGTAVRAGVGLLSAGWANLYYANPTQTALTASGPGTAWSAGDYVQFSMTYEAA